MRISTNCEWGGFSKEAGAFLAGCSLASTPFRDAIGARLDFSTLGGELWPAALLSPFVLIGNRDLLRGLRELDYTGEVAVVAREEFDGAALKRLGAPTSLYPMRNAVDYAVEALTTIIRPRESGP